MPCSWHLLQVSCFPFFFWFLILFLLLYTGEPTPSHYVYSTPNIFPYSPYYYNLQRSYYLPNRLDPYSYSFTKLSSPTSGSFIQKLVLLPSADPKPADATCGTCGQNAHCSIIGGRPVCACLRGYSGDPVTICHRVECLGKITFVCCGESPYMKHQKMQNFILNPMMCNT